MTPMHARGCSARRYAAGAWVVLVGVVATTPLEAQSGRVFSAIGDWTISGETDRAARPNARLDAEEAVVPPSDALAGDRLVVWFEAGRIACSSLADGRTDCFDRSGVVCLSDPPGRGASRLSLSSCLHEPGRGRAGRFLASMFRMVGDDLTRYMPLLSRRVGAGAAEAVLPWTAGSVNVATLMERLPEGRYRICLNEVGESPAGGAECSGRWSRVFTWEGAHARIPYSVDPGLYELTVDGPFGSSSSWILLVDRPDFVEVSEAFEAAQAETRTWVDADPVEIRTRLRAWLAHLARR